MNSEQTNEPPRQLSLWADIKPPKNIQRDDWAGASTEISALDENQAAKN